MRTFFTVMTFAICAVLLLVFVKSCRKLNTDLDAAVHQTDYWRDRCGREHARTLEMQGNYQLEKAIHGRDLDSAADLIGVQRRQIDGLIKVQGSAHGESRVAVQHDTVKDVRWLVYRDSTLQERVELQDDSASVVYDVNFDLKLVPYWKRKWLLARKVHYVDASAEQPNVHITNLQAFRVVKDPGRFGIGPYIGVDANGRLSLGLAVTYSIIRF